MLRICMREKISKVPNKIIWDISSFDRNMKKNMLSQQEIKVYALDFRNKVDFYCI